MNDRDKTGAKELETDMLNLAHRELQETGMLRHTQSLHMKQTCSEIFFFFFFFFFNKVLWFMVR
jgi:hypothetical protein